jgi:hypothetical protein
MLIFAHMRTAIAFGKKGRTWIRARIMTELRCLDYVISLILPCLVAGCRRGARCGVPAIIEKGDNGPPEAKMEQRTHASIQLRSQKQSFSRTCSRDVPLFPAITSDAPCGPTCRVNTPFDKDCYHVCAQEKAQL